MSEEKKLTVEQKQDAVQKGKNFTIEEDKARKENPKKLTIYDLLTPDEHRQLVEEGAYGDTDGDDQIGDLDREKTDDRKPEKSKGPIFEDTDIIDYMFKKWLIAGADEVALFAIDSFKYGCFKGMQALDNKKSKEKEKDKKVSEHKDTETEKFKEKSYAHFNQHLKSKMDLCDEKTAQEDFKLLFKTIRDGNPGDVDDKTKDRLRGIIKNLSPAVKKSISQLTPEQRNAKFSDDNAKTFGTVASKNAIAMNQFASSYAQARMLDEKCHNSKEFEGQDEKQVFALYEMEARRDFIKTLNAADQKGHDIGELGSNLVKSSAVALKKSLENVWEGKYEEKDKSYKNTTDNEYNPALDKIKSITESYKEGSSLSKPMSPEMAALQMSADYYSLNVEKQNLGNNEANNQQRKDYNNKRRASAKERIQAMKGFVIQKDNFAPRKIDPNGLRYAPQGTTR